MTAHAFLDAFLQPIHVDKEKYVSSSKNSFTDVPSSGVKPSDIYKSSLAALNRSIKHKSRAPGLVFENASLMNSTEPHTPGFMKPHICCHTRKTLDSVHIDAAPSSRAELGHAELFVEVRADATRDFFVGPPPDASHEELRTHDFFKHFQNSELKRRAERAFGQHIAYAMETQARQHRSFDILVHPQLLSEIVLRRLAFASASERGHDVSVEMATPMEELRFLDVVAKYVQDQLDITEEDIPSAVAEQYQQGCVMAVRVLVEDCTSVPSTSPPVVDHCLVSRPITSPLHLVGRATRGEQEGTVVAEPQAAGVRNVPELVAQSEVYQQFIDHGEERSISPVQHTETRISVSTHIGYRLVLGTVDWPVRRLKGTNKLLHAAYDVFQAMRDASSKTSRLHRDISIGNTILVKEPGRDIRQGYLIDWETPSRCGSEGHSIDRSRTGTWKFMPAKVLFTPALPHTLEDDMESLLYVVLYCSLLYVPHNLGGESTHTIIHEFFGECVFLDDEQRGGYGKTTKRATLTLTTHITFNNPDLQKRLDDVRDIHGPHSVSAAEAARLWKNPGNLDAFWRDYLATHVLARADRVENKLPDPETLRRKLERCLPPPPHTLLTTRTRHSL
ncbi:hypothetical protein BC628DRAFT_1407723 [Trametes gibbosa]|nr:hypothetical protein BC628DRAFT_1407723 [Trametes gibbosa]